ncbi:MAG: hypothetical protein HUU54_13970 [Ignavibacteriaceae bacterium]|nr:hypothetical protein [Ignavibacteriaceae bacterium]
MKLAFLVYHDILDTRVSKMLETCGVDFYTKWEQVTGKGHQTDPHLGTRVYPGYNSVRMIAFAQDKMLEGLIEKIKVINLDVHRDDDKIRLFVMPLERII